MTIAENILYEYSRRAEKYTQIFNELLSKSSFDEKVNVLKDNQIFGDSQVEYEFIDHLYADYIQHLTKERVWECLINCVKDIQNNNGRDLLNISKDFNKMQNTLDMLFVVKERFLKEAKDKFYQ